MDEVTPKRKLRRLSFHVLLTIAIVAVGFAQETMEETEIRRGKEFRAEGQLDSSIAHFEAGRALLRASTQRELLTTNVSLGSQTIYSARHSLHPRIVSYALQKMTPGESLEKATG